MELKALPESGRSHPHASDISGVGATRVFWENGVSRCQGRDGGRPDAPGVGGRRPGEGLARGLGLPARQGAGMGHGRRVLRPLVLPARHLLLLLLLQDDFTQLLPLSGTEQGHWKF